MQTNKVIALHYRYEGVSCRKSRRLAYDRKVLRQVLIQAIIKDLLKTRT